MFTKDEVNYLEGLINIDLEVIKTTVFYPGQTICHLENGQIAPVQDVKEEIQWRIQTGPRLILVLKKHRGEVLNRDEETYLFKLFAEYRERVINDVSRNVYEPTEVQDIIDGISQWLRLGIPAAKKFQDRYLME